MKDSQYKQYINLSETPDRLEQSQEYIVVDDSHGCYPLADDSTSFDASKYNKNLTSNCVDYDIVNGNLHLTVEDDEGRKDVLRFESDRVNTLESSYRRNTLLALVSNLLILFLLIHEGVVSNVDGTLYNIAVVLTILECLKLFIRHLTSIFPDFNESTSELVKEHPKFMRFLMGSEYCMFK